MRLIWYAIVTDVSPTVLKTGSCSGDGIWTEWREMDGPSGFGDFEALSWHTSPPGKMVNSEKSRILPPGVTKTATNVLECKNAIAVEGWDFTTGSQTTDQIVRFGIDAVF